MTNKVADTLSNTAYVTSGGTTLFGLATVNEIAMVGGLLVALATFVVNWVYRHKHYKLEQEKLRLLGIDHDRRSR